MVDRYTFTDDDCSTLISALGEVSVSVLTPWEVEFIKRNTGRKRFTDKQRNVCAGLVTKYTRSLPRWWGEEYWGR